jgi:hypothetical protein
MREMTTIAGHSATVIPFTTPRSRLPQHGSVRAIALDRARNDGPLPDNVVVLARFARQSRRSTGRFWLGGPPEGEAA